MGEPKSYDNQAFLSESGDTLENITDIVESEPSHINEDLEFNGNSSHKRYELASFSLGSDQRLKRGTIHSIELHNFKSYYGTVIIDRLSSFNAIIGPNGSGKSNLMDAISFVLCIRTSTLRGSNLRDLINKNPDPSDPLETRYSYVSLTLKGDTEYSVFKRAISSNGHVSYIYNNNVITFKGYTEALHEYKIDTLGSTGLIFQGSVNDIITRSPYELTKLFENISGSSLYEKPYNFIKEKLERSKSDYKNLLSKKKNLTNELKQLRLMVSSNKKYHKELEEYNSTLLNKYACQFTILQHKFQNSRDRYNTLSHEYEDIIRKYESSSKSKNTLEEKMSNLYYNQGRVNRLIQQKTQTLNNMRNSMTEFFTNKVCLENKILNIKSQICKTKEELSTLNSHYDDLRRSKEVLLAEIEKHSTDLERSKLDSFSLTESQMEEYNKCLKKYNDASSSIMVNINLIRTNINQYKSENRTLKNQVNPLKSQLEQVESNLSKYRSLVDSMECKKKEYKDSLETLELTIRKLNVTNSELLELKKELNSKKESYEETVKSLNMLKHEHGHMFKRSLANNEMCKAVSGVYGEVLSLFEISNSAYSTPIMASLGTRAHAIVAKDYGTISQCLQYLKDHKSDRRDFIPLDSLNSDKSALRRSITLLLRRLPKVNYVFAINCIDFQDEYSGLFEYLLGDTVIVETLDDAEKIATLRSNQRSEGVNLSMNLITHKGQMITKNKTIIIGSTINTKNSEVELEIAQYNNYVKLLNDVQQELNLVMTREKEVNEELQNSYTKLEKYKRNLQSLTMKLDFFTNHSDSLSLQKNELLSEISKLNRKLTSVEKSLATLNGGLLKENENLDKLRKDHFSVLNKKLGVEDIYAIMSSVDENVENIRSCIREKRVTLSRYETDLAELKSKMSSTEKRLPELESQLTEVVEVLEEFKKTNSESCETIETVQREISEHKKTLEEYVKRIEECKSEIKSITFGDDAYGPDGRVNVMEEITALKEKMKGLFHEAVNLSELCKVKNVPLNLTFPGFSSADLGVREFSDLDYSNLEFPKLVNADEFNFSGNLNVLETHFETLQESLKSLEKSLGASRSYTGLDEKLELSSAELESVEKEAEVLRNQVIKLESDFENIRRERSGLFMDCFKAVKESVGPIYRKLSYLEDAADGQAFLSLDDPVSSTETESFNLKIRYNTMPPMKKYLDLNLQSGGEKALSSIALLLALHNYRQSPFVVLDEIDANIDSLKLKNLTRFLTESNFQVIIISLKDRLFSRAQRLIGVYRNHPNFASRCVVLNLEEYLDESDDE